MGCITLSSPKQLAESQQQHQQPTTSATSDVKIEIANVPLPFSKVVQNVVDPKSLPETPEFMIAYVYKVYDGDTVHVISRLNTFLYRFGVRFYHSVGHMVNAEEMKGGTAETKARAVEAKNFVAERIMGKYVLLQTRGLDKYGRTLARIYYGDALNPDVQNVDHNALISKLHDIVQEVIDAGHAEVTADSRLKK
jgi:endonuclease YncB( thermonuclease family)